MLSVSVDTVTTHREWQEKELSRMVEGGAQFPMIADEAGRIGSLYGVYDEINRVDLRAHFLIDPAGLIQAMEAVAAPLGRNINEILRQLRALKRHQETGELMPCGWEPGKPVLASDVASTSAGRIWEFWKPRNAF